MGKDLDRFFSFKILNHSDRLRQIDEAERGIASYPYPVDWHVYPSNFCNHTCGFCIFRQPDPTEQAKIPGWASMSEYEQARHAEQFLNRGQLSKDQLTRAVKAAYRTGAKLMHFSVAADERIPIVAGDEIVVMPIGDFVDRLFGGPSADGVHEKLDTSGAGFKSFAIDDDGRLVRGEITAAYRHIASEDLYCVTLQDGREVKVTGSHSLNAVVNGRIAKVKVSDLAPGDLIACAPWAYHGGESRRHRVPVSQKGGAKDCPDYIEDSNELYRLLGYFTAEGSGPANPWRNTLTFTFGRSRLEDLYAQDVASCCQKVFGFDTAQLTTRESSQAIGILSVRVSAFFESVGACGIQRERRVPSIVWTASAAHKLQYLKALFSGDGCFRARHDSRGFSNSLHLKTASQGLAQDVAALLRSLGCKATVLRGVSKKRQIEGRELGETDYYSVNVYDSVSLGLLKEILLGLEAEPRYSDSVHSVKGVRGAPQAFGHGAFVLPIKSIRRLDGRPMVYDLTVAGTHRFITASGIGCSNSGGGEPLVNKHTHHAMKLAGDLGMSVALSTNGSLLTKQVACEVDFLRISLNAGTKEQHDRTNHAEGGSTWGQILEAMRDSLPYRLGDVGFAYVIDLTNASDIYEFCKLAVDFEVDFVHIRPGFYYDAAKDKQIHSSMKAALAQCDRARKDFGDKLQIFALTDSFEGYWTPRQFKKCLAIHTGLTLTATGEFAVCQDRPDLRFGKSWAEGKATFEEVWHSKERLDLVSNIVEGKILDKCPRCVWGKRAEVISKMFIEDDVRLDLV